METASIETIRRGYDGFVALSVRRGNANIRSTIIGNGYSSSRVVKNPVQEMVIKLLKQTDSETEGYFDARATLGVDWKTKVENGAPLSC